MPTYEYECGACGNKYELFQRITEKPQKRCPACRKMKARRLIGKGAGIIFKGSGFYQTDYRSESYHKRAKEEKGTSSVSSGKDSSKGAAGEKTTAGTETGKTKTAGAGKD